VFQNIKNSKDEKASQNREMEAHVSAEAHHSRGPFHTGWMFKTKEDWVAYKELRKEEQRSK
jgi:hypothetical protein